MASSATSSTSLTTLKEIVEAAVQAAAFALSHGRATATASGMAHITAEDGAVLALASSECAETALEAVKAFAVARSPAVVAGSYPKATASARGIAAAASRSTGHPERMAAQNAAAVAIGAARKTKEKASEILKELQAAVQAAEQAVAAAEAAEQAAVAAWTGFTWSGGGGPEALLQSRMDEAAAQAADAA